MHLSVAIGRDGRLSGPALSEALCEGLRATGMEVIDVGAVADVDSGHGDGILTNVEDHPVVPDPQPPQTGFGVLQRFQSHGGFWKLDEFI